MFLSPLSPHVRLFFSPSSPSPFFPNLKQTVINTSLRLKLLYVCSTRGNFEVHCDMVFFRPRASLLPIVLFLLREDSRVARQWCATCDSAALPYYDFAFICRQQKKPQPFLISLILFRHCIHVGGVCVLCYHTILFFQYVFFFFFF